MKLWMPLFFAAALLLQFSLNAAASDNQKKKAKITLDANSTATKKTEAYKEALQQSEWIRKLENNLGQKIIGISLWQFIAAFLVILAGLIIKRILISIIEKKITEFVEKTEAEWDDLLFEAITKPVNAFIMIGAVHVAVFLLVFNLENIPTAFTD